MCPGTGNKDNNETGTTDPAGPASVRHAGVMMGEATQLDAIAARLMAVQRHWNDPDRELHLAAALESSRAAWHAIQAALGSLIALTHALAGSLKAMAGGGMSHAARAGRSGIADQTNAVQNRSGQRGSSRPRLGA